MTERYLIGIDLGTTAAKCVVYDSTGTVMAEAEKNMEISYPSPGMAEQDAMDFYTYSCNLIRKCLAESSIDRRKIVSIGIDSQMGGIMAIDKQFRPVTYYDTPLDSRSASENIWMHANFGDLILKNNGSISTFGNKILYWKKRSEWKEIHKFIQPSAFVAGKLAGLSGDQAYMDETFICFSGLADLQESRWSDELCDLMKVDIDKLPRIVSSSDIIGTLSKKGSEDTGLPEGIPIAAGCGDQIAGFTGAGILKAGHMVDVSGTACILGASVDTYTVDEKHKTLATMKSAIGDAYYLISVVLGGRTHNWFIEQFFSEELERCRQKNESIYAYLDEKAAAISPGSDGLVSINYLQGRFFPPDPNVRGLFIGHSWAHTPYHFYRAILESIAYDHYLTKRIIQSMVPGIDFPRVTAIGSGAESAFWMQIKADVLQSQYMNLERNDLATLGAALIGGYAAGEFKDIESVTERFSSSRTVVEPRKAGDKVYQKYIRIYENLFPLLKDTYKSLADQEK
jgi:xylulokinase